VLLRPYSSIYISVPVLVWLKVTPDSFVRVDDKEESGDPEKQPA
jgi:hypothetical protein